MQVTVESRGTLGRTLKVEVPAVRVQTRIDERLRSMTKTAKVKGFRPGKVPLRIVHNLYRTQVEQEVVGEVLEASFYEALSDKELRPAGAPRIEPQPRQPGEDLVYTASFDVYPVIELTDLTRLALTTDSSQITEADIDTMVESLRKQRTDWREVDRSAADGDRLAIDFKAEIEGQPFDGGQAEGSSITLGSGGTLPDFEAGLTNGKAAEVRTFPVRFPETYGKAELAGKTAQFTVTIRSVSEPHLPALDQKFVSSLGVSEGTIEALRKKVAENLQREMESALRARNRQKVLDLLLEKHPIELPASLVEEEAHKLAHDRAGKHADPHAPEMVAESQSLARRRIALGLILAELIRQQQIKADPARVRLEIERLAEPFDDRDAVIKWYYSQDERLREIESMVLEHTVIDWVLGQVRVTANPIGFSEITGRV